MREEAVSSTISRMAPCTCNFIAPQLLISFSLALTSGFQQGAGGYSQPAQFGYQNQGTFNQGYGQGYDQSYQAPMVAYGQPQAGYGQVPYSAPPPFAAPPPSEWKSASTPDGQIYYYNERTGQTQWEKPAGML